MSPGRSPLHPQSKPMNKLSRADSSPLLCWLVTCQNYLCSCGVSISSVRFFLFFLSSKSGVRCHCSQFKPSNTKPHIADTKFLIGSRRPHRLIWPREYFRWCAKAIHNWKWSECLACISRASHLDLTHLNCSFVRTLKQCALWLQLLDPTNKNEVVIWAHAHICSIVQLIIIRRGTKPLAKCGRCYSRRRRRGVGTKICRINLLHSIAQCPRGEFLDSI